MKNIVYMIVSSALILGVITIVLGLYRTSTEVTKNVTQYTNQMKDFDQQMMLKQGRIEGSDVMSEIDFFKDEKRTIQVELESGTTLIIDNIDRTKDIAAAITKLELETYRKDGKDVPYISSSFERKTPSTDKTEFTLNP